MNKRLISLFIVFTAYFSCAWTFLPGGGYKIKTIVIDAGHGGKDPGNTGTGRYKVTEKNVALDVALKVGELIKAEFPEIKVIYTRDKDVFIGLDERAKIANDANADLFISIHCNAAKNISATGTETFVLGLHRTEENLLIAQQENSVIFMEDDYETKYEGFDPNSAESMIALTMMQSAFLNQSIELSSYVQDDFVKSIHREDRGVKQAGFLVLRKTTMPAILIELGFLTNKTDEDFLVSANGKLKMATSIFAALKKYKSKHETADAGVSNAEFESNKTPEQLKAEAAAKAKAEADKKLKEEAELKAKLEAEQKRLMEENAALKAKQTEIKAKEDADLKSKQEAEAKAKVEADAKALSEKKIKDEAALKAKQEAEAKLKSESELKAKQEAEAKAKEDAALKAKQEADAKAKAEADLKTKQELEAKIQSERKLKEQAELRAKEAAAAKEKAFEELTAKLQSEKKAKEQADLKAQQESEAKAKADADAKAKELAAAKVLAETKAKEAEELKAKEDAERVAKLKAIKEQDIKEQAAKTEAERNAKQKAEAQMLLEEEKKNQEKEQLMAEFNQRMKEKEELEAIKKQQDEALNRIKNLADENAKVGQKVEEKIDAELFGRSETNDAEEKKAAAIAEQKVKDEAASKAKQEAEAKKVAEETKKKADAEAKAKLEAEQKAKLLAEQKAKQEAEARAKAEAEQKLKQEAEAKAKAEAESLNKEEIDLEEKAKKEAIARIKAEEVAELEREVMQAKKEELLRKIRETLDNPAVEPEVKVELKKTEVKTQTPVENKPKETVASGKLVFRVQFFGSPTAFPLSSPKFSGIDNIYEYQAGGLHKYASGNFDSIEAATAHQAKVRKLGYPDAFVVAFLNGERIDMAKAREILNK